MKRSKIGIIIRKCLNVAHGDKNCKCEICTSKIPILEKTEGHKKFVEMMLKLKEENL